MTMQLLYIDLFCGAGGTSTGVERARIDGCKCAEVIACVNHDANAIASHAANHPRAMHFTEDIRTLDLGRLKEFCIDYGIVDVTMRMLRIAEMKRIQGFGTDYVLIGTQEEQKKFLGNAVVTEMATALCETLCSRLLNESIRQAG